MPSSFFGNICFEFSALYLYSVLLEKNKDTLLFQMLPTGWDQDLMHNTGCTSFFLYYFQAFKPTFNKQGLEGETGGEQLPGGQGEQQRHRCHQGRGRA
jgi:hypothetical protein